MAEQRGKRRSTVALAIGFVLAIVGFGIILWEIWTTASIPLNTVTFIGIGVAGVGVAAGAIGLDRAW
jgi:hypothetical protein